MSHNLNLMTWPDTLLVENRGDEESLWNARSQERRRWLQAKRAAKQRQREERNLSCVNSSGKSTSCVACKRVRARCERPEQRTHNESPARAGKKRRGASQEETDKERFGCSGRWLAR
ncbi:uncharacterized protein EI90DRAFT_156745 [Cantharellus anzutake]|uniref:uncharacterized protein n=1 Tax=Cantharellus anzutake TaxID=1750568 RepID=UPI001908F25F|nr:uncharacterized protein EI90DRAFT_156745 [Cantharellus anzutake]KAF8336293.1 hypothetical protein EI90DRAFT_156745 [Cantharellus anzutake]